MTMSTTDTFYGSPPSKSDRFQEAESIRESEVKNAAQNEQLRSPALGFVSTHITRMWCFKIHAQWSLHDSAIGQRQLVTR